MSTINLEKIIKDRKLDKKELAQNLFPGNKHASLALNRVVKGDGFLDSNQISLLSTLTGIPIGELYTGKEWSVGSEKKNLLVFTLGLVRAELNTETWVTKVFKKGTLFHESVIHSGSIALSTYLENLSHIVEAHEESK